MLWKQRVVSDGGFYHDVLLVTGSYPSPKCGYILWLNVCKISTHLVTTALFCPQLYRSVVWMEQHKVVLFLRLLMTDMFITKKGVLHWSWS